MNHALSSLMHTKMHEASRQCIYGRLLTRHDLPALLKLEHDKWDTDQVASQIELEERIAAYPDLALGAFCAETGQLLASLFLKPVAHDFHRHVRTWRDCTLLPAPQETTTLFGISLTSRRGDGVDALLAFFWPYALKCGWRHVYLGSPIPGLGQWRQQHPQGPIEAYVRARRSGMPLDPQLRYYRGRGFTKIVDVKSNYFPHKRSLDYGVLLRGTIPLSGLSPLWRVMPLQMLKRITRHLACLL